MTTVVREFVLKNWNESISVRFANDYGCDELKSRDRFPLEGWTYAAAFDIAQSNSDPFDILLDRERISTGTHQADEDRHTSSHRFVFLQKVCVQIDLSQKLNKIGC